MNSVKSNKDEEVMCIRFWQDARKDVVVKERIFVKLCVSTVVFTVCL